MIKFFRQIRRTLLEQNQMGKYIKYAIGEIVLVVIGILIALSINNWNDYRIAKNNSKIFLEEMLLDLAIDTTYCYYALKKNNNQLAYQEKALSRTKQTLEHLDSLDIAYNGSYADFYITDRTFQKIQNTTQSKLIGFDTLYKSISNYYTFRKSRVLKNTEYELKLNNYYVNVWRQFDDKIESPKTVYTREIDGKKVKTSFPSLSTNKEVNEFYLNFYNSIKGRNTLRKLYDRRLFSLRNFKDCKQEADALIKSINEALNND